MFGVKDIFTTINLLGGVVAVCLCVDGRPFEAGVAVMLGYALGDTMDGWVARKLNSANQFGAEYDTIADHTSHIIAPATIVYTVYDRADLIGVALYDKIMAIALAGSIIVAVSIRHARNIVRPIKFKGVWAGLPRSVLGFLCIAYVNATLAPLIPGGLWIGVALIPLLSLATLTRWPFASHHLTRGHWWIVKVCIALFFVTTFGVLAIAPHFMFDILFFWMAGYSLASWMALSIAERQQYRQAVIEALEAG